MTLSGRVHVVAGGTGRAGTVVVRELLARGALVAVPSRSQAKLDRLRARLASPPPSAALPPPSLTSPPPPSPTLPPPSPASPPPGVGQLFGFVGDISDLSDGERLRDEIVARLGPIDAVVATLGEWWEGAPLTEVDPATWQRILADNLTSHFTVARAFLPALAERADSVYLALGGIASVLAVAGSGPISITGAAQAMMMRVLQAEMAGKAVRLHEVDVYTPIVTEDWDGGASEPGWLTGRDVGAFVADALEPGFARAGELFLTTPDDTEFPSNATWARTASGAG
ncbi:SDR family oxidoreductase [Actinoplanes sp. NPDC049596]|uniref:SDR family oxidoreductase n=1 Tax=unclassified Actinoplanes TaxID=2626549 RepID=UPI00342497E1